MRVSTLGYYVVATLAAVALHAAALPVLNERDAIQAHLDTRGDMDDPIDARGVAGDSFDTRGIQTIEDDDHAQARGMDDFDNDEIMDARDFDSPEADSFIDARGIGDSETDENAKRRFVSSRPLTKPSSSTVLAELILLNHATCPSESWSGEPSQS